MVLRCFPNSMLRLFSLTLATSLALAPLAQAHLDLVDTAFGTVDNKDSVPPPLSLTGEQRLITILATNDIHGGVEPTEARGDKAPVGGMAFWAGVAQSIRQGLNQQYGDRAAVLTVDAGDQFQGTLISNFNEGQLVFAAMNEVGYDAVVPGNHDYDFGPIGWLEDQISDSTPASVRNPRGALLRLVSQAKFPLISANTFFRERAGGQEFQASLSIDGRPRKPTQPKAPQVPQIPKTPQVPVAGEHPSYLQPYVIKQVAGARVALIGLDNPGTPTTTTAANVSDLVFEDEIAAYLRVRKELEGRADAFVVIVHNGNTNNSLEVTRFVEKLPAGSVDVVIAGHTHFVNNARVGNVPIIQSGAGGTMFGRVDLVWNSATHKLDTSSGRAIGGITLFHGRCAPIAQSFCTETGGRVAYEGVSVTPNARVQALIADARKEVAPIAGRKLGHAHAQVGVDRKSESALANSLTDVLRGLSGADIAFMNTGGIRAPIESGDITYEDLFRVVPFNNRGLVIGPMSLDQILDLLTKSIQTCGAYGALMQSGLRVEYTRDCANNGQADSKARLLSVRTLSGEVLLDTRGVIQAQSSRMFRVATLDFLAAGGSGYGGFKGAPVITDLGVVREVMADELEKHPASWSGQVDGRWLDQNATQKFPRSAL